MKKELILQLRKKFEESAYQEVDLEYWLARDLCQLLGYTEWENFLKVIEKAQEACVKSKQIISEHFVEVNKTLKLPNSAEREVDDFMLTRYACYIIAQNGDPRKITIAFAQSYFALQTRKQELLESRIALNERLLARDKLSATEKELSKTVFEHGVDGQGFGRIRSKGDAALFGGNNTLEMKKKLKINDKRALADFLPTITIKAKDLAAEISNFNIKKKDFQGEGKISKEHIKNNQDVRELLAKSGIVPERLAKEEDIRKLKEKVKREVLE